MVNNYIENNSKMFIYKLYKKLKNNDECVKNVSNSC